MPGSLAGLSQLNAPQPNTTQDETPLPTSPGPQRIVLTGFMGAGKSTVGRLLAERLKWRFEDLDDAIVASAGASIPELFVRQGESWFRELEHETLRQLLGAPQLVLALGGGAIEDPRTRALLLASETTCLVHLEATLATVLERCAGTEAERPVLRDRANLEVRYHRRLPLYRESHLSLAVDALPPEAVVSAVVDRIQQMQSAQQRQPIRP